MLVAVAVAVGVALLVFMLPRRALLTVSATGPVGQSLQGVRVTVDGQVKCVRSPCSVSGLGAGDHTVRVTTDEHGSAEQVVAMRWGLDHSVSFSLTAACREASSGTPGTQGSAEHPPEEHGRPAETETVTSAATAQPEKVRPLHFGTIKANSIPVSKVLVDGRFVGQTPIRTKSVPGHHTVAFVHSEYGRKEVTVQVKPDEDALVSVQLQQGGP
jgi:serine/threonine-protein kinase